MSSELLKALVARGHQCSVQLSMPHPMFATGPYTYEGVNVHPYQDQFDPLKWLAMPEKPELIVAYLENTLRASILGDMHNIPVAVVLHNGHTKSFADLRWGCKLAVYNTEWMRTDAELWWRTYHSDTPPPGIVVHPPIDRERYRVKPPSASAGHVTLINLFEEKGPDVFYALAARFPRLKFLGVRGAYGAQDIRRGLPNVEIIPHVAAHDMPRKVYARTRILLMPSSYESYGRAGVEAACSGIPTIAHPTAGLLEALGDGGTFCDRDDLSAC
jgi:glycosyltransferase involved in cell wall biosynthesis